MDTGSGRSRRQVGGPSAEQGRQRLREEDEEGKGGEWTWLTPPGDAELAAVPRSRQVPLPHTPRLSPPPSANAWRFLQGRKGLGIPCSPETRPLGRPARLRRERPLQGVALGGGDRTEAHAQGWPREAQDCVATAVERRGPPEHGQLARPGAQLPRSNRPARNLTCAQATCCRKPARI